MRRRRDRSGARLHYGDFYQTLTGECRMNEQLRRYILASTRVAQPAIDALTSWLLETVSMSK